MKYSYRVYCSVNETFKAIRTIFKDKYNYFPSLFICTYTTNSDRVYYIKGNFWQTSLLKENLSYLHHIPFHPN